MQSIMRCHCGQTKRNWVTPTAGWYTPSQVTAIKWVPLAASRRPGTRYNVPVPIHAGSQDRPPRTLKNTQPLSPLHPSCHPHSGTPQWSHCWGGGTRRIDRA